MHLLNDTFSHEVLPKIQKWQTHQLWRILHQSPSGLKALSPAFLLVCQPSCMNAHLVPVNRSSIERIMSNLNSGTSLDSPVLHSAAADPSSPVPARRSSRLAPCPVHYSPSSSLQARGIRPAAGLTFNQLASLAALVPSG